MTEYLYVGLSVLRAKLLKLKLIALRNRYCPKISTQAYFLNHVETTVFFVLFCFVFAFFIISSTSLHPRKSTLLHEILQKEKDMKNTTSRMIGKAGLEHFWLKIMTLGLKSLCIMTESQVLYHLAGSNSINKYFNI